MKLKLLNLDQKSADFKALWQCSPTARRHQYLEALRRSWVYHDHALEGIVLTEDELLRGIAGEPGKDVCEDRLLGEVHRLYLAIDALRDAAAQRAPLDLNSLKNLHVLCSMTDDLNAGRYRKGDQPSGPYNHDCAPARSISYRMRKLVDFIQGDATRMHPVRAAAHVHLQFMHAFPFDRRSGRTGRLLLNAWLMRDGYPPAIIPASARSEYFDTLKGSPSDMVALLIEVLGHTMSQAPPLLEHPASRRA